MGIYYRFKSEKSYRSIPIAGRFISVLDLKREIIKSKCLNVGRDFDLIFTNVQTDEVYTNLTVLIPDNTSLLVQRTPAFRYVLHCGEQDRSKIIMNEIDLSQSHPRSDTSLDDELGDDIYVLPEVPILRSNNLAANHHGDISTPSMGTQHMQTPSIDSGDDCRKGRHMLDTRTPPKGYVCHRCNVLGHFIQHCPTNGNSSYDKKTSRSSTHISSENLKYTKKEVCLPSTHSISDLHPELKCPLCKEVMKNAVMTTKCCFRSFCDKCIRDQISSKSSCVCGGTNIRVEHLIPNNTLRQTIICILNTPAKSGSGKSEITLEVQDMQYVQPVKPNAQSSPASTNIKDLSTSSSTITLEIKDEDENNVLSGHTMEKPSKKDVTEAQLSETEPAPFPYNTSISEKIATGDCHFERKCPSRKKGKQQIPKSAFDMQSSKSGNGGNCFLAASSCNPYYAGTSAASFPVINPLSASVYYRHYDGMGTFGCAAVNNIAPSGNPCYGGIPWSSEGHLAASHVPYDARWGQTAAYIPQRWFRRSPSLKTTATAISREDDGCKLSAYCEIREKTFEMMDSALVVFLCQPIDSINCLGIRFKLCSRTSPVSCAGFYFYFLLKKHM